MKGSKWWVVLHAVVLGGGLLFIFALQCLCLYMLYLHFFSLL